MLNQNYIKVKDRSDLVRDKRSNAIVSVNADYYYAARARREKAEKEKKEIDSIKNELAELKEMMKALINKNNES